MDGRLNMEKFDKEINNAIKIINNAISEAVRNNINPVIVEVPYTGRKFCKPIREYFENQGWEVTRKGKKDFVDDGWMVNYEKVSSIYTLYWAEVN